MYVGLIHKAKLLYFGFIYSLHIINIPVHFEKCFRGDRKTKCKFEGILSMFSSIHGRKKYQNT